MPQINLLPWRERLREERKREFLVMLGGIVVIAAGLVFLVDRYYRGELSVQQSRNELISREIAVMDSRLAEISRLRQQRADILDRMEVIRDLQGTRPVIVYVFDELVRTLPDGIHFNRVQRTGNNLRIEGIAESNSRVSELMRRVDESPWFTAPNLQQISATTASWTSQGRANSFLLSVGVQSSDGASGTGDTLNVEGGN